MVTLPKVSERHQDPRKYPRGVAYMDSQYVPMSEAKVSVLDWGFLHSDATYDTVHVWENRFFRLDLHIERFIDNVDRLHMQLPIGISELNSVLHNCVALSGLENAYVEMICTRSSSSTFSRDPREAENRFIAFAVPFGWVANEEQRERGLHVGVSTIARIPPQSVDPRIKNYHWLDLLLGLYDVYEKGAETALLTSLDGMVSEGPGLNVFVVNESTLYTPIGGVLPGITRRTVFDLCEEIKMAVRQQDISPEELRSADEVFITSTAGGIMPVTKVDNRQIANGTVGPVTNRLIDEYWAKHKDPHWSTAVRSNHP